MVAKRFRKSSLTYPLVVTLLLSALAVYAFFQKALFNGGLPIFDAPLLITLMLAMLLGLVFCISYIRLKDKPALWPMLFISLIPITVWISSFNAVTKHGALMAVLINAAYALIFAFGYVVIQKAAYRQYAAAVLLFIGYAVVLFGFLNWMGFPLYEDAVALFSGEYRLMSVFQYANTYGAYLVALGLASLFAIVNTKSAPMRYVASAMLPLVMISLVLTLSRGAWLVFPVMFLFLLLFLRMSKQVMWILTLVASTIPAAVLYLFISNIGIEQQASFSTAKALLGIGLLLVAAAASVGLVELLNRFLVPRLAKLSALDAKSAFSLWLPLGFVVLTSSLGLLILKTDLIKLLPDHIEHRVASINFAQHSVLERFSFYKDAFKISQDYPLFGAGGGAWNALYDQYQSYPYISTQVHSFALQHLVETGWIGLIVLVAILAVILINAIIQFIRRKVDEQSFVFFIWATALLSHSLIDFNLSFITIGAIVYGSLGILAQQLPDWTLPREGLLQKSFSFVLPVVVVLVLFTSFRAYDGHLIYKRANNLAASGQASAEQLNQTLVDMTERSKHPAYLQFYFHVQRQLYLQYQEPVFLSGSYHAVQLMQQYEPHRQSTFISQYLLYLMQGERELAIQHLLLGTERFPWELEIYDEAFKQLLLASPEHPEYLDDAIGLFNRVETNIKQLEQLPPYQVQSKYYEITEPIAMTVARIHLIQSDFSAAYDVITRYVEPEPGFQPDDHKAIEQYLDY